jgi:2-oxoglutarate ferredoxin oxidoreductase subunit delta
MAGKIVINAERCKGCGLCVVVCPKKSIAISAISNKSGYFPAQADCHNCTGCAACAIICPEAVIEVLRDGSDRVKITIESAQEDKPDRIEEKP